MSDELKPWSPEYVKALLDEGGIFTDLTRAEYERIANEHNADVNATLENIWELAAKAQAMRDVPNEHERKLYEAIEAARSRAAVKERGEDTKRQISILLSVISLYETGIRSLDENYRITLSDLDWGSADYLTDEARAMQQQSGRSGVVSDPAVPR